MMIDIAENAAKGKVSIKEISERQNISVKYLEQIVPNLIRAGLLRSERGASGGYMLTREPSQYTIGEILRAIEGRLAPVACLNDETNYCERSHLCKTLNFWTGLYQLVNNYVDSVTLQEFLG
jgi:Rrf2 family protein